MRQLMRRAAEDGDLVLTTRTPVPEEPALT